MGEGVCIFIHDLKLAAVNSFLFEEIKPPQGATMNRGKYSFEAQSPERSSRMWEQSDQEMNYNLPTST